MKKFILLLIIIALLVVSFACIKVDNQAEEPIVETPVEEPEEIPTTVISPVAKVSIDNLTVLDEFAFDFDKDGEDETIVMYTAAQQDSKGEILWDDGQNWMLLVQDTDKDYILVDDYVQLGSIDFNIYNIEEEFYVATYSARTASLTLNIYKYNTENDTFEMTTPFNTRGNVNMLKSSRQY